MKFDLKINWKDLVIAGFIAFLICLFIVHPFLLPAFRPCSWGGLTGGDYCPTIWNLPQLYDLTQFLRHNPLFSNLILFGFSILFGFAYYAFRNRGKLTFIEFIFILLSEFLLLIFFLVIGGIFFFTLIKLGFPFSF